MTPARERRLARAALVLVPLLGLVLAWSGPLSGQRLFARDLLHYYYPHQRVVAESLRAGELPLWNPYVYAGVPLAGQGDCGTWSPFQLLFLLGEPPAVLPWFLLAHHVVALLGAYALLRGLGRSRGASAIGAAAFALSGPLVANHMNPRLLVGAAWIPAALAAFDLALRRARGALPCATLAGLALGLMLLGSGVEAAYLTGLFLALRVAVEVTRRRSPAGLARVAAPRAALLAVALATGAGVAGVALVPLLETTASSSRSAGVGRESGAWGFHPARAVTLVAPGVLGEVSPARTFPAGLLGEGEEEPWHTTVYAGAAVVALAAFGLRRAWRRAPHLVLAGALAFALALGDATPLAGALRAVLPGIEMLRFAEKWLVGAALVVPLLAAFGADALRASSPEVRERAWRVAAVCAGLLVVAAAARGVADAPPMEPDEMARLGLAAATLAVAGWTLASAPPRRALPIVLALVVLDLGVNTARHLYTLPRGVEVTAPWAATSVARLARPGDRVIRRPAEGPIPRPDSVDDAAQAQRVHACETLVSNAGAPWCENVLGFLPGLPGRYAALWEALRGRRGALLDLLGVRFAIAAHHGQGPPAESTRDGVVVADHPTLCVAIVERPGAKERARLFERVVVCADDEAALALARGDPEVLAVVAPDLAPGPLALPGSGEPAPVAAPCQLTARTPGSSTVQVESARGGGLLVAAGWDPGWRAAIDGQEARVLPAWGALQAVLVPPGRHVVTLVYRPTSFRIGLAITCVTLAFVAAVLVGARRAR